MSEVIRTEDELVACTNCCGAGYFGQATDCRVCGGTGRVVGCRQETDGRRCQLKAGHMSAHSCWSMGAHVSWYGEGA